MSKTYLSSMIFIIFTLFMLFLSTNCYHCEAPLFQSVPGKVNLEEDSPSSTSYKSLKIKIDYTNLDIQNKNSGKHFDDISYSQLKLSIEESVRYMSSLVQINHQKLKGLKVTQVQKYCKISKTSETFEDFLIDYDIIIIPYLNQNLTDEAITVGNICIVEEKTSRPIVGELGLNPSYYFGKENSMIFLEKLIFHQLIHILAFNPFVTQNKKLLFQEDNKYYITSPKVILKAKAHFNCDKIKGIEIDSDMFHWKPRYMLGDIMINKVYSEMVLSEMTLALIEDTGFYKVNYFTGGLFGFGKNEGCAFLEEKCKINDKNIFPKTFCEKEKQVFCSRSRTSLGDCSIEFEDEEIYNNFNDKIIDDCFISTDYKKSVYLSYSYENYLVTNCRYGKSKTHSHYGEVMGENSACFESSLIPMYSSIMYGTNSICYNVTCDWEKKEIEIHLHDEDIRCPTEGGTIKGPDIYAGELECPEFGIICRAKVWCNELFDCIDKRSEAYFEE